MPSWRLCAGSMLSWRCVQAAIPQEHVAYYAAIFVKNNSIFHLLNLLPVCLGVLCAAWYRYYSAAQSNADTRIV